MHNSGLTCFVVETPTKVQPNRHNANSTQNDEQDPLRRQRSSILRSERLERCRKPLLNPGTQIKGMQYPTTFVPAHSPAKSTSSRGSDSNAATQAPPDAATWSYRRQTLSHEPRTQLDWSRPQIIVHSFQSTPMDNVIVIRF